MTNTRNSISGKRPPAKQPARKKAAQAGGGRGGRPGPRRPAQVSRAGLALMAVTGLVGLGLAVHGWSGRSTHSVAGPLVTSGPSASASHPASPSGNGQSATASPSPTASTSVGAPLSSQSYSQYAYQVWPGVPSSTAKAALSGLSVSVKHQGNGIVVVAGARGQPSGQPKFYAGGAKVYIIEAAFGDDSGNVDYNFGDDGLVVVNAAGRLLQ